MSNPFYYLRNPETTYLEMYKAAYEAASKTVVSLEYLQKADTYCFFHGPKMVGGLVLSSAANGNDFRYFSIFQHTPTGEAILRTLKRKYGVNETEAVEISCIWMHRKLSPYKRIYYYWVMLSEAIKVVEAQRYKYVFGGSVELTIQRFQQQFFSNVFYLGIKPPQETGALAKIDGSAVMIYFLEASSLKYQSFRLLHTLIWHQVKAEWKAFKEKWLESPIKMVLSSR